MMSYKNRIYGLVIGGAIADSMGAVVAYQPNHKMLSPTDSSAINIQPGYWTEPTGLWYGRLCDPESTSLTHKSCTGVIANVSKYRTLSNVVQASVFALEQKSEQHQFELVQRYLKTGTVVGDHLVKFWVSLIDAVLHQVTKKTLFNPDIYIKYGFVPEIYCVLSLVQNDFFNTGLEVVQEVLRVFRQTDNFVEGLRIIVNESVLPNWAGALYGQLAGAYYGLTDIPESWMDVVQDSEAIVKHCDRYLATRRVKYYV